MKKILVALAIAVVASSASALDGNHNMTTQAGISGTNGTCLYCHAAHLWTSVAAFNGVAPLWNRNDVGALTVYTSSTVSSGIVPGPNSRTCLSCHDGVSSIGAVLNGQLATDPILAQNLGAVAGSTSTVVGLDLRDDHPVGVLYVEGSYYNATTLPLPQGRVECSSCHEPHATTGNTKFLRLARATLCQSCHNK